MTGFWNRSKLDNGNIRPLRRVKEDENLTGGDQLGGFCFLKNFKLKNP